MQFKVYYSYDIKDKESNYAAGDKNAFVIEADDRRLIDSKIVIARIQQIAKEKCATLGKGHTVFYANYYKIDKLEGDEST